VTRVANNRSQGIFAITVIETLAVLVAIAAHHLTGLVRWCAGCCAGFVPALLGCPVPQAAEQMIENTGKLSHKSV
jgi:hypothetical protein